jgi:sensor histidine kinase regulating citrate/malate metabolism
MTDVLLIVFVIAAVIIAGFALEKHSKKTRQELMDELADEEPTPAPAPKVKQMVESQEEATAPKPAKKRRRGRPAAKKD